MRKREVWKRMAAVAMTGAMTVGMLAGCGSGGVSKDDTGKEDTKTETAEDGEVVEITFWDQNADPTRTEVFNKLIEDFEAENPDIKVNFVPVPADQAKAKYDVAIQSGTAPDCGGVSQYWMSDFIVQDALVSLDEYIENWDEKDNTIEAIDQSIRDMAPDGNMYGLAQMFVTPVVWYNTNMLEQTGYDVPENWDDIFACIEAMTDKDAGKYGFAIRGGAGNSQQLEKMLYQYSGITEMFDEEGNSTINDPAHVELLDRLAKIYNVYTAESDITAAYTEMVAAFDSGSAGIIYHNLGSYGQHLETLGEGNFAGIVSLKAKNDTTALVSDGAMCLSVFKDSKHPEEAFRFISYLCEHEACSYISEKIGQIPCNKEALGDEWINEVDTVKESADALLDENTTIATLPINVIGYYDLHSNELVEGFQNVLLGNMSAQEYLDGWADQMTKLKADYDEYMKTL